MSCRSTIVALYFISVTQGVPRSCKVMNFSKTMFQVWKVMENNIGHGKSWNVHGNDCKVMGVYITICTTI